MHPNYIKVITTHHPSKEDEKPNDSVKKNPLPKSITELMRPKDKEGNKDYHSKYRYHFNRKLSEYAVSELMFVDYNTKQIPFDKCLDLLKGNNLKLPETATEGDLYYIVNKIRSEHSLETVKNDAHAIKLAVECLENPNKSEGDVFIEWLEHMYRAKKDIIWEKFIN